MDKNIDERILNLINEHHVLTLATAAGNKPYCCNCYYVYDEAAGDPDNGVAPGTKWDDLPADWVCPLCGVGKEEFKAELLRGRDRKGAAFPQGRDRRRC